MEEGTTQEKYVDERVLYTWCDGTKKKGTLCKSSSRGGRFGKSSEIGDITIIKNFLKKMSIRRILH